MEKSGNEDDFQPFSELWNTFNNHCVLLLLKNFQLHSCVCFTSVCCAIWKNVKTKMKKTRSPVFTVFKQRSTNFSLHGTRSPNGQGWRFQQSFGDNMLRDAPRLGFNFLTFVRFFCLWTVLVCDIYPKYIFYSTSRAVFKRKCLGVHFLFTKCNTCFTLQAKFTFYLGTQRQDTQYW